MQLLSNRPKELLTTYYSSNANGANYVKNANRTLNVRLVEDIRQNGGRAELVGPNAGLSSLRIPDAPQSVLPITRDPARRNGHSGIGCATGREAGRFTLGSKVTVAE